MSIALECGNGHALKVKDELAGKKIKCPKCQVIIQVPLADAEVVDDLLLEPAQPEKAEPVKAQPVKAQPVKAQAVKAQPITAQPTQPDATNFSSLDFDVPAAPQFASSPPSPTPRAQPASGVYSAPVAPAPIADLPSEFGGAAKKSLLIYGGTSVLASFLIVLLSGLLFFSPSANNSSSTVVAQTNPTTTAGSEANTDSSTTAPSTTAPSTAPTPAATTPSASQSSAEPVDAGKTDEPASAPAKDASSKGDAGKKGQAEKGKPQSPNELQPIFQSDKAQGFALPHVALASIFDPASGRFLLCRENGGILVFNMADVLAGKLAAERQLEIGGKPLALCLRTVNQQQFLLVSTQDNNLVQVFKTSDWSAQPSFAVPDVQQIIQMECSPRADSPTLFMAAVTYSGREARLVSYDFATNQSTTQVNSPMISLAVSPDGRFVALYDGSMVHMHEWDGRQATPIKSLQSSYKGSFASDRFIESINVRTGDGTYVLKRLPGTSFVDAQKQPVGVCWTDNEVHFASTNDYRTLHSLPLPQEWAAFPVKPVDAGLIANLHHQKTLYFDEKQQIVIGRHANRLLVLKYGDMGFPKEVDLRPGSLPPATIDIGQQMVGSFGLPTGVTLKVVPTMDSIEPVLDEVGTANIVGVPMPPVDDSVENFSIIKLENVPSLTLPLTKEDKVAWKPGKDTLGGHLLRLEATLDNVKRDLFHRIQVTLPSVKVPFQVFGLSCDRDQETAIAWGYASPDGQPGKWQVAIVDLTRSKPIRTVDIPDRILSGCLDKSNFYLCVASGDRWEQPVPTYAGNQRSPSGSIQLVAYDLATLKSGRKAPLTAHANHMESINGKELILDYKQTINLPNLTATAVADFNSPNEFGRVGNGWMSNGVLYDKDLRKPLLCTEYPKLGRKDFRLNSRDGLNGPSGYIRRKVGGPYYQIWYQAAKDEHNCGVQIANYPGFLKVGNGVLELRLWPRSLANAAGDNDLFLAWRKTIFNRGDEAMRRNVVYPIATSNQSAVFAADDRLWIAPLAGILPPVEFFQFAQVQDKFVLNAHKPTTVIYRANQANEFKLDLLTLNQADMPNLLTSLESKDGKFNIELNGEEFAKMAEQNIRRVVNTSKIGPAEIKKYQQECKEELDRIADTKVSGVVVPIFAVASATHKDGQQRCLLSHIYLVEVSPNAILKLAQPTR